MINCILLVLLLLVSIDSCTFTGKSFDQFGSCKAKKQQYTIEKSINSVIGSQHNVSIKSPSLTYQPKT